MNSAGISDARYPNFVLKTYYTASYRVNVEPCPSRHRSAHPFPIHLVSLCAREVVAQCQASARFIMVLAYSVLNELSAYVLDKYVLRVEASL
jgi:hypothetical protein